jgi:putative methionine-R-sulfoxide reductase with GAF domain
MTTRYRADEYAEIAKRVKELESETSQRINGISLEDAKPVEAPADIDWTGIYGYQPVCGFKDFIG